MITDQLMIKDVLFLYAGPIFLLFLVSGLIAYSLDGMDIEPILTAWGLAAINFAAALRSLTLAQKVEPVRSMLLVFGGGGIRMLVMISAVIVVMIKKAEWMLPFCIVLLMCFVAFLIVEIVVIHKRGLLQHH